MWNNKSETMFAVAAIIITLKTTHNKLIIQPKCAFLSTIFGFLNFDLGGWRVQIRNSRDSRDFRVWWLRNWGGEFRV